MLKPLFIYQGITFEPELLQVGDICGLVIVLVLLFASTLLLRFRLLGCLTSGHLILIKTGVNKK